MSNRLEVLLGGNAEQGAIMFNYTGGCIRKSHTHRGVKLIVHAIKANE